MFRPATPLALDRKPSVSVSVRLPARSVLMESVTLPVVPALMRPGAATDRLVAVTAAVTSRLSW